jgi:hypothetical protein
LQHTVGWFDQWLMDVPKPEYEVAAAEEVPGQIAAGRETSEGTEVS